MTIRGQLLQAALPLLKLRAELRAVSLGVQAIVLDLDDRVLLVRPTYLAGWHFPGGGVEPGETADAAIRRELAEEGGVELAEPPRLVGLFHNPQWTRGDHVAFFETGAWRCCPRRWGLEIEAAAFFALDRLPESTASPVINRLAERAGAPQSQRW
jgi:ADP-ribose pyrophosphatase YjhB (NUDIX family)